KTLAQSPIQFRIACLPEFVAHMETAKINVPISKLQHRFCATSLDGIHAPTLLFLVGMSSVEHHPVAKLEWTLQFDKDFFSLQPADLAEKDPALFSKTGMDQGLIVSPAEPAGVQPAGESHLHIVLDVIHSLALPSAGRAKDYFIP